MKIDKVECKYGENNLKGVNIHKLKEVIISNHGCEYKITSDFKGIKIEKMFSGCISNLKVFPDSKNSIILS